MNTYGVPMGCTRLYNADWDFTLYIIPVVEREENIVIYTTPYGGIEANIFQQGTSIAEVLEYFGQSDAIESGMGKPPNA